MSGFLEALKRSMHLSKSSSYQTILNCKFNSGKQLKFYILVKTVEAMMPDNINLIHSSKVKELIPDNMLTKLQQEIRQKVNAFRVEAFNHREVSFDLV